MVTSLQTILTCSKVVTAKAMAQVVQFMYTGEIDTQLCTLEELKQVSKEITF